MVKNGLLLSLVSFGVSFSLSLLINRDIKTAMSAGLTTVPATFLGIAVVNRKKHTQRQLPLVPTQIHQIEKQKKHLMQSLSATVIEKQRIRANINFLKAELSQLYAQTADQRSYKQQLTQDLITIKKHRGQLEAESQDLQTQIYNLKQRREELYQFLRSTKEQKQNAEASLNSLASQIKQLQLQVVEKQYQKQELEISLAGLNQQQPLLLQKTQILQLQIQELEHKKAELNQSLSVLTATKHKFENNLKSLPIEFIQLQNKTTKQEHKEELENNLTPQKEQRQLKADKISVECLPDDWAEFIKQLTQYEFQVLKAITYSRNPSATLKKIAEENITMPELLIDLINDRALNTIGDLLIEPGTESFPPIILEEYLTNVKKVIKIKEKH